MQSTAAFWDWICILGLDLHFGNGSALWDFILMQLTLQNPLVWISFRGREVWSETKLPYLVSSHVFSHNF